MQQSPQSRAGGVGPEPGDERGFAAVCVFGHGFAERSRIALRVEQIVGELEGLAEG